jgi:threonine dehydratase
MARSLSLGHIVPVAEPPPPTRCDALQTKLVSTLTFGALSEAGARGLSVSEEEVERAMVFAFRNLRIVAEPGGSVALAALISGKVDAPEGSVVVVSGGNVDPRLYAQILGR